MPYISIGKYKLYYEVEGSGAPLVLIAGFNSDIGIWARVRAELARHFQLILLDNRGLGKSDCFHEEFTLEDMALDVIKLIQSLELKRPHLIGHSMGGAIVQIIALKHSQLINKTIFSQSLIKIAPATRAALTAQLHLLQDQVSLRRVAETILPWLFSDALIDNPDFCESFLCLNEKNPNPPSPEALAKQLQAILKFDSRSWYSQILTPSLILFGDEDRLCPPNDFELMATRVCNAKHYIFRGVGHVAQIERPDEYCRVVCDFLK